MAGDPSFREVARAWGFWLTGESLAYPLSRFGLELAGAMGIEITSTGILTGLRNILRNTTKQLGSSEVTTSVRVAVAAVAA